MIQKTMKLISKNEMNGKQITLQFADEVATDPQSRTAAARNVITVQLSDPEQLQQAKTMDTGKEFTISIS